MPTLTLRQLQALAAFKADPKATLAELGKKLGCSHVGAHDFLRRLERAKCLDYAKRQITPLGERVLATAAKSLESTLTQLQRTA